MSSLADLSDLVGFFSYSREDDQGSRGALSALRDAIQSELSAQLGRSHTDFRVWQDKAAIPLGTLWENQIRDAINQSAFFVPIVTPRAMRSQHCTFEFESFLAREAELGRDDLVFPILYIPVPALEDEKLWRQDPVLKIVGTRQYLDWRDLRHLEHNSPEVRQKVERFCRNISSALRKPWVSLEQRRREAEAEARQRAEEEHRRNAAEIEAARLAELERRNREAEAARRAHEQERTKAAAEQRAQADGAFTAAKRANSITAIDAFLASYPKSHLEREAQTLLATLRERDEAHRRAVTGDDPVVLRAFRDAYKKGADVDQIRKRLQLFEATQQRRPLSPAVLITSALVVFLGGAGIVWLEMRPGPNAPQVSVAATPSRPAGNATGPATKTKVVDTTPTVAPPAPIVAPVAPPPEVEVDIPAKPALNPAAVPGPSPDDVAWLLLKDTTDIIALRRFIAQFPDSPLRKDAEKRIAALAAEQTVWNLVKDSTRPNELRRFIEQFPDGAERPEAEQRIASLSAAAARAEIPAAPDPHELTRSLQFELMRVGCFSGTVNGEFDDPTKAALQRFIKLTSLSVPNSVSPDAINAVRGFNKRICPLACQHGQHSEGEACVANEPPPKHAAARAASAREPTPRAGAAPAGEPAPQVSPQVGASPRDSGCIGPGNNSHGVDLHRLPGGGCGY
jgi:hypothetical protein